MYNITIHTHTRRHSFQYECLSSAFYMCICMYYKIHKAFVAIAIFHQIFRAHCKHYLVGSYIYKFTWIVYVWAEDMHSCSGNGSNPIVLCCDVMWWVRMCLTSPFTHTFHIFFWFNATSNDFQICVNFIEITNPKFIHTHTRKEAARKIARAHTPSSEMKRESFYICSEHNNHFYMVNVKLLCVKYNRTQFHFQLKMVQTI